MFTATELMTNSAPSGCVGSQLSPPLTQTATALRPAIATILPATPMLTGAATPGSVSLRQVSPKSGLTNRAVAVAANHRLPVSSKTLMRVSISLGALGWTGFFFVAAPSLLTGVTGLRNRHLEA